MTNVGFNRDSREGGVSGLWDEEETCADVHPPLPNIRLIDQQRNMSYTVSVLNTPWAVVPSTSSEIEIKEFRTVHLGGMPIQL